MTITPADMGDTQNDWLGRSQFNDALFKGSFDEFRIHEGAMTASQVVASFAAGPSTALPPLKLQIRVGTAGELIVSWPSFLGERFLEYSPALGPQASWQGVADGPSTDGDVTGVTISAPAALGNNLFFRLTN
jgi:hypothetical protein